MEWRNEASTKRSTQPLYQLTQNSMRNTIRYKLLNFCFLLGMISASVQAQVMPFGLLQSGNTNEIDDSTDNIEPECAKSISSIAAGTGPNSVAVWGNYAYVTDQNNNRMNIYNVSNKTSPTLVNAVATGISPFDIIASIGYAYVAVSGSLRVFDLSNPELPVLNQTRSAFGNKSVISGNYLYLRGSDSNKITVFDISTPTSIQQKAVITIDFVNDEGIVEVSNFIISGNYAYVIMYYYDYDTGTTTYKLWTVNVTNPTKPVVLGSIDLLIEEYSGFTFELGIFGNYLYAFDDLNSYVIDISNPAVPLFLKKISSGDKFFNKIKISGNYLLITSNELLIYDLNTDPATPSFVRSIPVESVGKSIVVSDNYAYVINDINKLEIFKLNCSD
jgi:hypothetical protein